MMEDNKENDASVTTETPSATRTSGKQQTQQPSASSAGSTNKDESLESNQGTKLKLMKARNHVQKGEFDEAVELYGSALESGVKRYGDELSIHLAPLYKEYGSTLLQQAQTVFDMLGGKKTDKIAEENTNQSNSLASATFAALNAHASPSSGINDTAASSSSASAGAAQSSQQGESTNALTNEEEDERNELLEIAWETLETARKIYTDAGDTESKKELISVLKDLADVSLENGQFSTAIGDYENAVQYCREVYSEPHRTLADLYTHMGLAYIFSADEAGEEESSRKLEEAHVSYREAVKEMWKSLENTIRSHPSQTDLKTALTEVKEENERKLKEFQSLPAEERAQNNEVSLLSFSDRAGEVTGKENVSDTDKVILEEAEYLDGLYEKLWELSVDTEGRRENTGMAAEAAEAALSQVVQQMGGGEAETHVGFGSAAAGNSTSSSSAFGGSSSSEFSLGTVNTLQPKPKENELSSVNDRLPASSGSSKESEKRASPDSRAEEPSGEKKSRSSY